MTITFTSKIGHAAENAIKTSRTEYHRCVGGMTSLRDMLTPRVTGLNNVIPPPGDAARPPWEDGA